MICRKCNKAIYQDNFTNWITFEERSNYCSAATDNSNPPDDRFLHNIEDYRWHWPTSEDLGKNMLREIRVHLND